ncbi:MAG: hypothetical protein NTW30_04695 [Candidatus Aenigmarchaeota archaeon]|nr:hypothetical protein [Candidatus Aenigmarchaeota archaeon]
MKKYNLFRCFSLLRNLSFDSPLFITKTQIKTVVSSNPYDRITINQVAEDFDGTQEPRAINRKHVKIVTKEPGDEQTRIVTGRRVTDVDLDRGFLMVETRDGEACLSIQAVVAIKPRDRN